jgi:hypothetical protein
MDKKGAPIREALTQRGNADILASIRKGAVIFVTAARLPGRLLLHHAIFIQTEGPSYRLRQHAELDSLDHAKLALRWAAM